MNSENESIDKLWKQILQAIRDGKNSIVFWGFNDALIELLRRVNDNGLDQYISSIVDPNAEFQGKRIGRHNVSSPELLAGKQLDVLVITTDSTKEKELRAFAQLGDTSTKILIAGTGHLAFQDPLYQELLSSSFISPRAFGYTDMLTHIYQSILYLANNRIEGNFAEFGVYKAGTTVFIARLLEKLGLKPRIYAFDTFSGFPQKKSALDMYDDPHDESHDFESVRSYCQPYNIELIKGDITETYRQIEGVPLAFSFFDTDNYSPTKAALEMCYEQTVRGGVLAFDHYFCDERWLYTVGERVAVKEFFVNKNILNLYGTGIFLKI